MYTDLKEAAKDINRRAEQAEDFLFLINYKMDQCLVCHPDEASSLGLFYNFRGTTNLPDTVLDHKPSGKHLKVYPPTFETYHKAFNKVMNQIQAGNTYLINLCFESNLNNCPDWYDIMKFARSDYKIMLKNQFICFSPETFITIEDGFISTYPMKGTIPAELAEAENKLLDDPKELAEHYTIVDLLRNDLSIVARDVEVIKFRYLSKIHSRGLSLWQTSSEIRGKLEENFINRPGSILLELLPAGSITGAPKKKTIEILDQVENIDRGFYTGVAGICQNGIMDSCVLIRFIEKRSEQHFFKSGGGITFQSDVHKEYAELIDKIYVPFT